MVRRRWTAVAFAVAVAGSVVAGSNPAAATPASSPPDTGAAAAGANVGGVFQPDERTPVTDTTSFPGSATVLLTFTGGQCTGFMISERTVATAGHCVHTGAGGQWRSNLIAYPGYAGDRAPYGSCRARAAFAASGWTRGSDPGQDYGAVQLDCAIGNATGWYPLGWTNESVTGACTVSQGYPADRRSTQWRSQDHIRAETASTIYHQHDTSTGQDGSPLYLSEPDDWCPTRPKPIPLPDPDPDPWTVFGIHTSGPYGGGPGAVNNLATRITQAAYRELMSWR
ncbi:trypsin-like serine protease [Micromonosporaceae bacterium B7E4]